MKRLVVVGVVFSALAGATRLADACDYSVSSSVRMRSSVRFRSSSSVILAPVMVVQPAVVMAQPAVAVQAQAVMPPPRPVQPPPAAVAVQPPPVAVTVQPPPVQVMVPQAPVMVQAEAYAAPAAVMPMLAYHAVAAEPCLPTLMPAGRPAVSLDVRRGLFNRRGLSLRSDGLGGIDLRSGGVRFRQN